MDKTLLNSVRVPLHASLKPGSDAKEMVSAKELEAMLSSLPTKIAKQQFAYAMFTQGLDHLTDEAQEVLNQNLPKVDPAKSADLFGTEKSATDGSVLATDKTTQAEALAAVVEANAAKVAAADATVKNDPKVREVLINMDAMRQPGYQKGVEKIKSHRLYKEFHLQVQEDLDRIYSRFQSGKSLTGSTFDKDSDFDASLFDYAKPLYDIAAETAQQMGMPEPILQIFSSFAPNAYVYGVWQSSPRVHFFSSIVRVAWDSEKNDWVSPMARAAVKSVMAHEMGHIKDRVGEWRFWARIIARAGRFFEGHEDGPMFTAEQKKQLIEKAKKATAEKAEVNAKLHGAGCACCQHGMLESVFGLDGEQPEGVDALVESMAAKISEDEAVQLMADMLGIDFADIKNNRRLRRQIEMKDGMPTKFGMLQSFFIQGWAQNRAGEIVADRASFAVLASELEELGYPANQATAVMDYLLYAASNMDQMGYTDADKRAFWKKIDRDGIDKWMKQQKKDIERSKQFSVLSHNTALDMNCVSHPPGVSRIELGQQYVNDLMTRETPFPTIVKEIENEENPLKKVINAIRLSHIGLHSDVTKFISPEGFDEDYATAQILAGLSYGPIAKEWKDSIDSSLKVLDEHFLTDAELEDNGSDVFKTIMSEINKSFGVKAWKYFPAEYLTAHLLKRIEGRIAETDSEEGQRVLEQRYKQVKSQHESQLSRRNSVYRKKEDKLEDLIKKMMKEVGDNKPGGDDEDDDKL